MTALVTSFAYPLWILTAAGILVSAISFVLRLAGVRRMATRVSLYAGLAALLPAAFMGVLIELGTGTLGYTLAGLVLAAGVGGAGVAMGRTSRARNLAAALRMLGLLVAVLVLGKLVLFGLMGFAMFSGSSAL